MPFGLTNAPASFQSLMNDIFRPYLRKFVLVFFDDILIYSASWRDHLAHLRQVFQVLSQQKLVINLKKCLLGKEDVEYLGHIVSAQGVRMDPSKVEAVMKWPTPRNVRGVHGFLGLTGYYRRFIEGYGRIAAPLTSLLKKEASTSWAWPKEAEKAFVDLKHALTSAPVLRMPNFMQDFVVECDASGQGIGAVLMQERRPIAYFSKQLSERALSKSAYERELMALVLAIQHWRPYLLGRHFVVRTDQKSLRQLLSQPLHTPAQQNWVIKLLGYNFSVEYKEGNLNRAADALSRREEVLEYAAISRPLWQDWRAVQQQIEKDSKLAEIKSALEQGKVADKHYTLVHGILFYKGRVAVPANSEWIPKMLAEFHITPSGGHAGAYRTYRRLAANVHWVGMMKHVTRFVAACMICQRNKYEAKSPAGLLSPLPIPSRVWEDISMDFVSGLPRAHGVDCILVVVDRFTKYAHFVGLKHPFTARSVAESFMQNIVRLHGIPNSIVSDRDPLFLSSFWRELFRLAGTKLKMSSAYHPETDGQSEVLNRCLETYLRCFSSDRPKQWSMWLSWAEYSYNTSYQSAAGMTPFEAVYGRPPPNLQQYLPGEIRVQSVLETLRTRDEVLAQLRFHLSRAQERMIKAANKHRRDVQFEVGEFVYLKYRPFRQSTLFKQKFRKLAPRFFGPFKVLQRIGAQAYFLDLPSGSKVHPVFHVSLLKKAIGTQVPESNLPEDYMEEDASFLPEFVISRRTIEREGQHISQVLIKWTGLAEDDASWMDESDVRGQFPFFSLEDKAVSEERRVDTSPLMVYQRGSRKVVDWAGNVELGAPSSNQSVGSNEQGSGIES